MECAGGEGGDSSFPSADALCQLDSIRNTVCNMMEADFEDFFYRQKFPKLTAPGDKLYSASLSYFMENAIPSMQMTTH